MLLKKKTHWGKLIHCYRGITGSPHKTDKAAGKSSLTCTLTTANADFSSR